MSVGGSGIPRLQHLSYLEVGALQVREGASFEQIRRAVVSQAADVERENDLEGSYDQLAWERVRSDPKRHVHNTVDVLKELMRLGWVEPAVLPSGPSSAYLHTNSKFDLTPDGERWTALAGTSQVQAYNELTAALVQSHPQFQGFLQAVGVLGETSPGYLTIPIYRLPDNMPFSENRFLDDAIQFTTEAAGTGTLGWRASADEIDQGMREYVSRIVARAASRPKVLTRKQFVNVCEEAACKVAFNAAGTRLDYITMELLRRWTRFLGLATFSYYSPGPSALRLWSTARAEASDGRLLISRRVGRDFRKDAMLRLLQVWQPLRAQAGIGMYVPVWTLRAAACWEFRIHDDEFDRAVIETIAGEYPEVPFEIHLDQASVGGVPASVRPLVVPTNSGVKRAFNVINLTLSTDR